MPASIRISLTRHPRHAYCASDIELEQVRQVEQKKCRREIAEIRVKLNEEWVKKMHQLQQQEEAMHLRHQQRQREFEEQSYRNRQQVFAEIDTIRAREREARRSLETDKKRLSGSEEHLKEMRNELQQRLNAVDHQKSISSRAETDLRRQLRDEREKFQIQLRETATWRQKCAALQQEVRGVRSRQKSAPAQQLTSQRANALQHEAVVLQGKLQARTQELTRAQVEITRAKQELRTSEEKHFNLDLELQRTKQELEQTKSVLVECKEESYSLAADGKSRDKVISQQTKALEEAQIALRTSQHDADVAAKDAEAKLQQERLAWRRTEGAWRKKYDMLITELKQRQQREEVLQRNVRVLRQVEQKKCRREIAEIRVKLNEEWVKKMHQLQQQKSHCTNLNHANQGYARTHMTSTYN